MKADEDRWGTGRVTGTVAIAVDIGEGSRRGRRCPQADDAEGGRSCGGMAAERVLAPVGGQAAP